MQGFFTFKKDFPAGIHDSMALQKSPHTDNYWSTYTDTWPSMSPMATMSRDGWQHTSITMLSKDIGFGGSSSFCQRNTWRI